MAAMFSLFAVADGEGVLVVDVFGCAQAAAANAATANHAVPVGLLAVGRRSQRLAQYRDAMVKSF
jgi:hypothetical protein